MNIRAIVYYLGWLSLPISALSLLNIIFCSYFKYNVNLYSYVIVLGLVLIFFLFSNIQKILNYELNIIEKIFLILIGWFFFPLFLSVPYYFSFYNLKTSFLILIYTIYFKYLLLINSQFHYIK